MTAETLKPDEYFITDEPYYEAVGDEIEIFEAAYQNKLAISLCMAISYNPGYQSMLKDIKQSTRQRFVSLEFNYPNAELEQKIVEKESGLGADQAKHLVRFAQLTRNLKGAGLDEGASTRLLVHAGKLMVSGIAPVTACASAVSQALTDDGEMIAAVNELCGSVF